MYILSSFSLNWENPLAAEAIVRRQANQFGQTMADDDDTDSDSDGEAQALVIDNGSAMIKAGFAGDDEPRSICIGN